MKIEESEIGIGEEINLLCGGGEEEKRPQREKRALAQLWNAWFVRTEWASGVFEG